MSAQEFADSSPLTVEQWTEQAKQEDANGWPQIAGFYMRCAYYQSLHPMANKDDVICMASDSQSYESLVGRDWNGTDLLGFSRLKR